MYPEYTHVLMFDSWFLYIIIIFLSQWASLEKNNNSNWHTKTLWTVMTYYAFRSFYLISLLIKGACMWSDRCYKTQTFLRLWNYTFAYCHICIIFFQDLVLIFGNLQPVQLLQEIFKMVSIDWANISCFLR